MEEKKTIDNTSEGLQRLTCIALISNVIAILNTSEDHTALMESTQEIVSHGMTAGLSKDEIGECVSAAQTFLQEINYPVHFHSVDFKTKQ